jgi:hypothetical protein
VPVDVSQYGALTFFAKGDGKSYQVKVEMASVEDYDYHQFVFTAPPEWRQFVIPLSLFKQQGWGQLVPFTRIDVRTVAWASVGPHCDDSVQLSIDRVAFVNSLIVSDTTGPTSTNDVVGPYSITTEINDDTGVETATLYYSVNRGDFVGVAMTGDGNTFNGHIPGQSMGSEVRYYIEAGDADGNLVTDPVDAPYATHRFRVEQHPSLLVDDFGDRNPYNILGGWSAIFKDPDEGGIITPCYDGQVLRLTFDVTDHLPGVGEYAGYYSELEQADLGPYNSIVFRVRGGSGWERVKIGLNDGLGHEPKIELSEYLPNGVTTSWQIARMPLVAFTQIDDWSQMDRLTLTFEDQIESGSGTLYVDDIRFEYAFAPIMVHNFDDSTDPNGLGGSTWTANDGGASITAEYDPLNRKGDSGYGLHISYTGVTSTAWAVWGTDLMGVDASEYITLSLYIKGGNGEETTNVYLLDDENKEFVEIEDYLEVTTEWQLVEIPLADFAELGIDLTRIRYLQFAFEWDEMEGTIYLDDIQFSSSNPCQIFLPIVTKSHSNGCVNSCAR